MNKLHQWLLEGEPWVVYRTYLDLLGESPASPSAASAYTAMLNHEKVQALLTNVSDWPGQVLKSHKKAGHVLHQFVFLADLGFRRGEAQIDDAAEKVLSHRSDEGPFQILVNIPKHFGGSGEDMLSWMLCDAGASLYALAKMGWESDPRVVQAADYLAALQRDDGGWPCAATASLGRFRGPGKKEDPCPYATLLMVKALLPFGSRYRAAVERGAEILLKMWRDRGERKYYLFAMGSGFEKLKAPFVWFDLLHVLDVLSQIPVVYQREEVGAMLTILRQKADAAGCFRPESIWMDWRGWDFGQKREPSRWLTFLACRILSRF